MADIPLPGLESIGKHASDLKKNPSIHADIAQAEEEQHTFKKKNYSELDDEDDYNVRSDIKKHFRLISLWIVKILFYFCVCLLLILIALMINYVAQIWYSKDEVEKLLQHIFTHTFALVAGYFIKIVSKPKNNGS